jgi:hypothetical protein
VLVLSLTGDVRGVAQLGPAGLLCRQCRLGPLRDQPPLFLGQRRVEVQHEGICIPAEFGHYERHALRHQPGNERDVTGKSVEFGHQHAALGRSGYGERRRELGPPIEGVSRQSTSARLFARLRRLATDEAYQDDVDIAVLEWIASHRRNLRQFARWVR